MVYVVVGVVIVGWKELVVDRRVVEIGLYGCVEILCSVDM